MTKAEGTRFTSRSCCARCSRRVATGDGRGRSPRRPPPSSRRRSRRCSSPGSTGSNPARGGSRRWPRSLGEFPVSVAAAVADSAEDDIAALLRAEIVREVRRFPELECTFRHGLLQEAALSTLTPTPPARAVRTRRSRHGGASRRSRRRTPGAAGVLLLPEQRDGEGLAYLERAAERSVTVEALAARKSCAARATAGRARRRRATDRADRSPARVAAQAFDGEVPTSGDRETGALRRRPPAGAGTGLGCRQRTRSGARTPSRWRALVRLLGQRLQDRPRQPSGASGRFAHGSGVRCSGARSRGRTSTCRRTAPGPRVHS